MNLYVKGKRIWIQYINIKLISKNYVIYPSAMLELKFHRVFKRTRLGEILIVIRYMHLQFNLFVKFILKNFE